MTWVQFAGRYHGVNGGVEPTASEHLRFMVLCSKQLLKDGALRVGRRILLRLKGHDGHTQKFWLNHECDIIDTLSENTSVLFRLTYDEHPGQQWLMMQYWRVAK